MPVSITEIEKNIQIYCTTIKKDSKTSFKSFSKRYIVAIIAIKVRNILKAKITLE